MTHYDVVVVGAGLSGISAAYHLKKNCPGRSFILLEGRGDIGGTWDLFRYPGVRSDSDMHTLGFSFKPWQEVKSIADGPSILRYLRETVEEFDIAKHIQFSTQVTAAQWNANKATWMLETSQGPVTGDFLFMCSGYYSYKGGYQPEFDGQTDFRGPIVHPQKWPENLDFEGKRIAVIGSGATAMTLVPAMAETAKHVTMVQRSPTYVVSRPAVDPFNAGLKKILPSGLAYKITRWRNTRMQDILYRKTRSDPAKVRAHLLKLVTDEIGQVCDVEKHFTPSYDPWDQRLCLIPDSDLFEAIKAKRASVVTDQIDTFTVDGIRMASGEEIDADIIVTATGLQLVTVGDMEFTVDGKQVDFSERWTYKGLGYSDIPNLISSFGYINASWTLRADLTCHYVTRLLNHMQDVGATVCTPRLRASDISMERRPWIDGFSSGYMQRMMALMPKQGDREPWINSQRFMTERKSIGAADVNDGVMQFTNPA